MTDCPKKMYFECPETLEKLSPKTSTIFLAGGITGCPDWQQTARKMIETELPRMAILNPRRANFDVSDSWQTKRQIDWEFEHLQRADIIMFWFPKESICPISLYELGRWAFSDKSIVVGCHPEYPRRQDVIHQMRLAKPRLNVHDSISALVNEFVPERTHC